MRRSLWGVLYVWYLLLWVRLNLAFLRWLARRYSDTDFGKEAIWLLVQCADLEPTLPESDL